jgi:chromosome segregation ATPase
MKDFVRKAERQSKDSINRAYRSIDMLHYEINFLNDLLQRYSNKKSGRTLTSKERQNEMNSIRERIPSAYKDINYYKECINAEKKEMKRIHDTYGFVPNHRITYEELEIEPTVYNEINEEYEGIEYEDNDEYVPAFDDNDDLEEIKDYKYNPVTDTWE